MSRLSRLNRLTYEKFLEIAGMQDAEPKAIRDKFLMTSSQQNNYKNFDCPVPAEVVLRGILIKALCPKKVAAAMIK